MVHLLKVIAVLAVTALVAFAAYEIYTLGQAPDTVTTTVPSGFTVNGKSYTFTYTATTDAERLAGLMNRKITNATTMLFAFPSFAKWSFWMYDTNTSLDMIWLNATGDSARVVYIATAVPPCYNQSACADYTPTSAANYVIEAKAGFSAANGIGVGTLVELT